MDKQKYTKLSEEEKSIVRSMLREGHTKAFIAAKFNISSSTVSRICDPYCARRSREMTKAWRKKHYVKSQRDKDRERLWVEANRERVRQNHARWRQENPERVLEMSRASSKRNRGKTAAYCASRRARKLLAQPKWLSEEDKKKMKAMYVEANRLSKETGIAYHVDHIIPLRGETVSGLHVPWNLQIIPAHENLRKSNKLCFNNEGRRARQDDGSPANNLKSQNTLLGGQ